MGPVLILVGLCATESHWHSKENSVPARVLPTATPSIGNRDAKPSKISWARQIRRGKGRTFEEALNRASKLAADSSCIPKRTFQQVSGVRVIEACLINSGERAVHCEKPNNSVYFSESAIESNRAFSCREWTRTPGSIRVSFLFPSLYRGKEKKSDTHGATAHATLTEGGTSQSRETVGVTHPQATP